MGDEKMTALLLMRKFIAYSRSAEPLQIKSVIAPEGVKGYIYVESYKQCHVKQLIDGVSSLRIGLRNQTMVPINQMTDVLRIVKEVANVKRGAWVRLKRGRFYSNQSQPLY